MIQIGVNFDVENEKSVSDFHLENESCVYQFMLKLIKASPELTMCTK